MGASPNSTARFRIGDCLDLSLDEFTNSNRAAKYYGIENGRQILFADRNPPTSKGEVLGKLLHSGAKLVEEAFKDNHTVQVLDGKVKFEESMRQLEQSKHRVWIIIGETLTHNGLKLEVETSNLGYPRSTLDLRIVPA